MSTLPTTSSLKQNNMSSKMIRSQMLQTRKSISYNRSRDDTFLNIILEGDESKNKSLLMSLGDNLYNQYFNRLVRSSSYSTTTKGQLQMMLYNIYQSLTAQEEKLLGIYENTSADLLEIKQQYEANLLSGAAFTFKCTVLSFYSKKMLIIKNFKEHYRLIPGNKYIFDLEDSTNLGTTLSFSRERYFYEDVNGIERIGTPGESGACLVYTPDVYSNNSSVYIYNKDDFGESSFRTFGYVYQNIVLEANYKIVDNVPFVTDAVISSDNDVGLSSTSIFHTIENRGPKYLFTSEASYNEIRADPSFSSYLWNGLFYENRRYGLYYGYYKFSYVLRGNRVTLINKGTNSSGVSKEKLIQIVESGGDAQTVYLTGLDETGDLDGSYNFFKGPLVIQVLGDFEVCPLYTLEYGYNKLENMLFFDSKYADYSAINFNGYSEVSGNNIICLHPETEVKFYDVSMTNVDYGFEIQEQPKISFNYSSGDSYQELTYGLYKGQYLIKFIPESRPLAIINKGKEDFVTYFGSEHYKKRRLGPDGNVYDFYYGTIVLQVFGNFGTLSTYEYNDGYCGGENIFIYSSDVCSDMSSNFTDWYSITDPSKFKDDATQSSFTTANQDISFDSVYQLSSYINCDASINTNSIVEKVIFEDISGAGIKYGINFGNYVLMDVPEESPIAFLNSGLESKFYYDGYFPYKQQSIASDGNIYDYYYGNVNIYVADDFGQMTFETLYDGFAGGFRKLLFNNTTDVSQGQAIPHYGITSNYPVLSSSVTDPPQDYQITISINVRKVNYSEDYVTYRFSGRDRNGVINDEQDNPTLTFSLGDQVFFTFEYDNSDYGFGIYEKNILIDDELLVTNNNNSTQTTMVWYPNKVLTNHFFYRSNAADYTLYNSITILDNPNADVVPDLSQVSVSPDSSGVYTILIDSVEIVFDQPINIDTSKKLYLYDKTTSTMLTSVLGTDLVGDATDSITYNTGFTTYNVNSLEFDTSYCVVIEEDLFQNIYYNGISAEIETFDGIEGQQLFEFRTEAKHDPKLVNVVPVSTSVTVDISSSLVLEFNEPVSVASGKTINFVDPSDNVTAYQSAESSGNFLYIYYSDLSYDTIYDVSFQEYSIVDGSNVEHIFADSSLSSYQVKTVEDPRPILQHYLPNDNLPNVYIDSAVSLIFTEPVYLGTEGSIQIVDTTTGLIFDSLDVSNTSDLTQFSGQGTNTLRIQPFESLTATTSFSVSIDSTTIKDICDNYYPGISSENLTFTTSDVSGVTLDPLISDTSASLIIDSSDNTQINYAFNGEQVYDGKQYTLSAGNIYTILDISRSYPIAILNNDVTSSISYDVSDSSPIIINISGGVDVSNSSGDYFAFEDESGNSISIADGNFALMRGRSYQFNDASLNDDVAFKLYYNGSLVELSSNSLDIQIDKTHSVDDGDLYYVMSDTSNNVDLSANISLLHRTVNESSENGNGDYDFYYGTITLTVDSSFGSVSYYSYTGDYLGGKYAFTDG